MEVRIKFAALGKWKECKNKELSSWIFSKKKKKVYYKSSHLMMFHNISETVTTTSLQLQKMQKLI